MAQTITIDDKEYDIDSLSDLAKDNLASLQFVRGELKKLQAQLAVYQTAERAYSDVVKREIEE